MENQEYIYVVFALVADGVISEKVLAVSKTDAIDTYNQYNQFVVSNIIMVVEYDEILQTIDEISKYPDDSILELFNDETQEILIEESTTDVGFKASNILTLLLTVLEDININAVDFLISEKITL